MSDISLSDRYKVIQQLQESLEREHAALAKQRQELQDDYDSYGSPHFLNKVDKCLDAANANSQKQSDMSERFTKQAEGIENMYKYISTHLNDLKQLIEEDIAERNVHTQIIVNMSRMGGQFEAIVNKLDWLADKVAVLADLQNPGFLENTIPDEE